MGTRLYPLSGGDRTKVWYPLGLDMWIRMNFFCGDGYEDGGECFLQRWYEIAKPVLAPSHCHP